ncbi:predicted protein [Naegleria gruberi]|uniref:Predicted protein n=1 Tax=Naegleria gruberi TaxID=5762 RepID=D2VM29_NAEGR|nr:uncharacterized protein NAEGRDRAFT_69990 [Naegleria gruberi]EFC42156.1 predicted protein [Naegleria gruberi]|eukprot:XP_002674900.1 predicted protein [Naegleria gruberi strain NEG-M]
MPARNTSSHSSKDKIPTKTEWTRSKPIDLSKRLPLFDIDTSNIISGTRHRNNIDYHHANLNGKQISVKRSSKNSIEKRTKCKYPKFVNKKRRELNTQKNQILLLFITEVALLCLRQ